MSGRPVVAAISAQGPDAPAFRVRTRLPAPALAEQGLEVLPVPLFSAERAGRFGGGSARQRAGAVLRAREDLRGRLRDLPAGCRTAWIQRQVDVLPGRRLERMAMEGRRVVLDVDDAIWLDATPQAGGHPLARLKRTAPKLRWLAGRADHVIAGNDLLAEWLQPHAERITVIPSLVVPDRVPLRRHTGSPRIVLGWIGSGTTVRYLQQRVRDLEALVRAAPDIEWELCAMGGEAPSVHGMTCRSLPWSERAETELLTRMDIGLMPLPDDPWTRGKCAYKALVYMSAGVPVVADDVGVTAAVVGHGECGFVTGSPDEWVEATIALARDASLRARLGAEGRRRTEERFSVRAWAPRLAEILRA